MGEKMEQISSLESFGRKNRGDDKDFCKIIISIGRNRRVAPNHIMCAIADRTGISGKEIGKIEIYDDHTIVGIPKDKADEIILKMIGCKINSHVVQTGIYAEKKKSVKPEKQSKSFAKDKKEKSSKRPKDKFKEKAKDKFRGKPQDKSKSKKKR